VVVVGGGDGESQLSVVVVVVVVVVVEGSRGGDGSAEPKRQDMVAYELAIRSDGTCVDVVASRSDGACEYESPCRGNDTLVYV